MPLGALLISRAIRKGHFSRSDKSSISLFFPDIVYRLLDIELPEIIFE